MYRLLGILPILILVIMTGLACNARQVPTVAPTPNIPATVRATIRQEVPIHPTATEVYERVSASIARICHIDEMCFQTGFSVNTEGGILTVAHGIKSRGASENDLYVKITRRGETSEFAVKTIVFAEAGDAAYLVTEPAHDMRPIPVMDNRDVRIGNTATMIGYPDSLYHSSRPSLTQGVITAGQPYTDERGRSIPGLVTDIAGAAGYSGSPILHGEGCVIAIIKGTFTHNPLYAYGIIVDRLSFLSDEYSVQSC